MVAQIPIGRLIEPREVADAVVSLTLGDALGGDGRRPERERRHGDVLKGAHMPRIVDLSQEIYTGMMVYPGHLKTVLFDHATHAETAPRFDSGFSFQTKGFLLNDNGPTHVDSFSHLDPDPSARDDRPDAAGPLLRRCRVCRRDRRRAADRHPGVTRRAGTGRRSAGGTRRRHPSLLHGDGHEVRWHAGVRDASSPGSAPTWRTGSSRKASSRSGSTPARRTTRRAGSIRST